MQTAPLRRLAVFALGAAFPALAEMAVSLTPSSPQPQPVGTSIVWLAGASVLNPGLLSYRFTVSEGGGPAQVASDFGPNPRFIWTPAEREGTYTIAVTVRDNWNRQESRAVATYYIHSRISSGSPAVSPTRHPLVALYSAPPCPPGSLFRARFRPDNGGRETSLPAMACTGATSMNVYIAGMYASTSYTIVSDVLTGASVESSPPVHFTTGAIDRQLPSVRSQTPRAVSEQGVVFYAALNAPIFATDLEGRVIWYSSVELTHPMRISGGGSILGSLFGDKLDESVLMEFDLAGNILRQTNVARINEQLPALGIAGTITAFHHDAVKLPNGNYLALAATERILADVQGPGDVDVLGDMILLLDSNFQVLWTWDSFDHLDVQRKAVLGEICRRDGTSGCPPIFKAEVANDWVHGNSVSLAPDGNIIYSARHQDFVYKIDFRNGAGDGHVVWRLGKDGDFTALSADPYPWQSHQHDAVYIPGTNVMTLFDNGNTRNTEFGGNSRGQALEIDETNRTVAYRLNVDLGAFAFAVGSAQALLDGGYYFDLGTTEPAIGIEVGPGRSRPASAGVVYRSEIQGFIYRSFRMRSLYAME